VPPAEATTLAGAFVIGLLAGALLTVRLTRIVADSWQRAARRRKRADDEGETWPT
jgi:hypothetical protein